MGSLSRGRINELWPGGGKYYRILNRVSVTFQGKSEIRDQSVFGAIKIFCLILEKKCLYVEGSFTRMEVAKNKLGRWP